jgi:hypothetical protein
VKSDFDLRERLPIDLFVKEALRTIKAISLSRDGAQAVRILSLEVTLSDKFLISSFALLMWHKARNFPGAWNNEVYFFEKQKGFLEHHTARAKELALFLLNKKSLDKRYWNFDKLKSYLQNIRVKHFYVTDGLNNQSDNRSCIPDAFIHIS